MKLVWAQFALEDRESIFAHIEKENPQAAARVDEEIVRSVRRLIDFPESGRPGRLAGTRELVMPRLLYRGLCGTDGSRQGFAHSA